MNQVDQEALYQQQLFEERQKISQDLFSEKIKKSGLVETFKKVDLFEVTALLRFTFILAITGDLFGLIPLVGSFINGIFAIVVLILVFINSLGKGFVKGKIKRTVKGWALKGVMIFLEWIPIVGFLPLLTLTVLFEIVWTQRASQKYIKKADKIINKLE